jgi:glutamyl-Q tRNA(Asp) synthetase
LEDLAWLGLDWDGPVRRQSEHLDAYRAVIDGLAARGEVYPCFCTRAEIAREIAASAAAPHGPDGALYPGTCRHLLPEERAARIAGGVAHAWRLDLGQANLPGLSFREHGRVIACDAAQFGDAVLARKDAPASYHLCVVHDDALQGVTLVTRGEDLLPATHLHRLLQALLGLPTPEYAHHALVRDASGRKLAKRDRAATLREMRAAGRTAEEVRDVLF